MLGSVPRLPVDLMFQSLIRDDFVGDYDYVKSLVIDLHSAMLQPQHSSRNIIRTSTTRERRACLWLWVIKRFWQIKAPGGKESLQIDGSRLFTQWWPRSLHCTSTASKIRSGMSVLCIVTFSLRWTSGPWMWPWMIMQSDMVSVLWWVKLGEWNIVEEYPVEC